MQSKDGAQPPRQKQNVLWRVSGRVHGIGYRWFVLQAARNEGIAGDVKNLDDGRVEIRAEGSPEQLARLRDQVEKGPAGAALARSLVP